MVSLYSIVFLFFCIFFHSMNLSNVFFRHSL
jgi:hypothetical protein